MNKLLLAVLLLLGTQQSAYGDDNPCRAQEVNCVSVGQWQVSLGVGLGVRTNPLVNGDDIPLLLLPSISYYGERFFWDTTEAGFTVLETRHQTVNLVATLGLDYMYFNDLSLGNLVAADGYSLAEQTRTDADTNGSFTQRPPAETMANMGPRVQFNDLRARHLAGLAGAGYAYYWPRSSFNIQVLQDFTGVHNGREVRTGLTREVDFGVNRLSLAGGTVWQDSAIINYYYGLHRDEVGAASSMIYHPGSAFTPYVRLAWQRPLAGRWTLKASVQQKWFGRAISASPLVAQSTSTTAFIGGVYHF